MLSIKMLSSSATTEPGGGATVTALPAEITTITLGVFSQMLGEGIAMSSLAFYLTRLGAKPLMVGVAISCFSVSQMTFAPIMVKLSTRFGCSLVLRLCLAGAAVSSLLIALSGSLCGSLYGVLAGRALAGVFAACVPVAQSGVTDLLPREQAALGLSRVAAASQLGIVVGPLASAAFQAAFLALGLPASQGLPAVFVMAAAFSLGVLVQMTILERRRLGRAEELLTASEDDRVVRSESLLPQQQKQPQQPQQQLSQQLSQSSQQPPPSQPPPANRQIATDGDVAPSRLAQPLLRTITIIIGWTAVLSNSIYGLFAPRFLGFRQPQLSATYSLAAGLMILTQLGFPRLVRRTGEHRACALGILAAGTGIGGLSVLRVQPWHSLLYMTNRIGAAVADTATAALVARSSADREERSHNLALLTSTRAAARIASPLISSEMFALSCAGLAQGVVAPGALPFVTAACFAVAVAPVPLWLLGAERRRQQQQQQQEEEEEQQQRASAEDEAAAEALAESEKNAGASEA